MGNATLKKKKKGKGKKKKNMSRHACGPWRIDTRQWPWAVTWSLHTHWLRKHTHTHTHWVCMSGRGRQCLRQSETGFDRPAVVCLLRFFIPSLSLSSRLLLCLSFRGCVDSIRSPQTDTQSITDAAAYANFFNLFIFLTLINSSVHFFSDLIFNCFFYSINNQ